MRLPKAARDFGFANYSSWQSNFQNYKSKKHTSLKFCSLKCQEGHVALYKSWLKFHGLFLLEQFMMISFAGWSKSQVREQCQCRNQTKSLGRKSPQEQEAGKWFRVQVLADHEFWPLVNVWRGEQSIQAATAPCPAHPGLRLTSVPQRWKAPDADVSSPNFSCPIKDSVQVHTTSI